MKAFNDAYIPFRDGHTIPETARHTLDAFTLTSNQYYRLITDRKLPRGQFISFDNRKLIFNEYTLRLMAKSSRKLASKSLFKTDQNYSKQTLGRVVQLSDNFLI